MIIDGHTHIHPDIDGIGEGYDARLETLLAALDAGPVDKAVVFAEAVDVPYIKSVPNEFVFECCAAHRDKLIGFVAVHPAEDHAPDRLRRAIEQFEPAGVKLHPRFQNVAADDPRTVGVVKVATEYGLPVAVDAYLWKPTPLKVQACINIDGLAKAVPGAKILMTHAGGLHYLDALAVCIANDNVLLEVSSILRYFADTPFEDQFIFVLQKVGARRIVWGSDHPQADLNACYLADRALLERHGFAQDDLGRIFGQTMVSVLPPNWRD